MGYDIHYKLWSATNVTEITAIFDKDASGQLTFENKRAKDTARLSIARKDNFDIIPKEQ